MPDLIARPPGSTVPESIGPESIAMIVADLDGTLLSPRGELSARTLAALRTVEAAGLESGLRLVFATGRRQSFAMQVLERAGLRESTVLITSNGAVTRTMGGTLIERHLMPAETARQLCRQMAEFRDAMLFTFDRVGKGAMVVERLDSLHRAIAHWVESNVKEIETVSVLEEAFVNGETPIQGMICGTLERMAAAMALLEATTPAARELRAAISMERTEYAARDLCILDLLPAACSKGHALARLAASYGISSSQVMAIGDNMNDAEMLAWCGNPVVMANAAPELHAIAMAKGWRIAASNVDDGAAQVIEAVLGNVCTRSEHSLSG